MRANKNTTATATTTDTAAKRYVSQKGILELILIPWCTLGIESTDFDSAFTDQGGSFEILGPNGYWLPEEMAAELLEKYARMGGFLSAVANGGYPAVRKLLERMARYPHEVNLWDLVRKYQSPGRLERRLWAVKRRAEEILRPFEGDFAPSWLAIANALLVTGVTGKAAVMAAQAAVAGNFHVCSSYRLAREWLAEHSCKACPTKIVGRDYGNEILPPEEAHPLWDNTYRMGNALCTEEGISVHKAYQVFKHGHRGEMFSMMTMGERLFHGGTWLPGALREVKDLLEKEAKEAAKEKELESFLRGEMGIYPVYTFEELLGNCYPSNQKPYLRRWGHSSNECISGETLLGHLKAEECSSLRSRLEELMAETLQELKNTPPTKAA